MERVKKKNRDKSVNMQKKKHQRKNFSPNKLKSAKEKIVHNKFVWRLQQALAFVIVIDYCYYYL